MNQPQKKGCFSSVTGCLGVFVVGVVAFFIVAAVVGGRTSAPKMVEAPVDVTAATLFAEYHANEVRADGLYRGKRLRVTGTVASIDRTITGAIVVQLATSGGPLQAVHASVNDSDAPKAAALTKGGSARLLCTGGSMALGSPVLRDCSIEVY